MLRKDMQADPTTLDRRRAERIPVALPVALENGQGVTRDVSASGVFFETALPLSPGNVINFSLELEHVDSIGPLRLHCRGRILRVERHDGKLGVAVAITSQVLDPTASGATRGAVDAR